MNWQCLPRGITGNGTQGGAGVEAPSRTAPGFRESGLEIRLRLRRPGLQQLTVDYRNHDLTRLMPLVHRRRTVEFFERSYNLSTVVSIALSATK